MSNENESVDCLVSLCVVASTALFISEEERQIQP